MQHSPRMARARIGQLARHRLETRTLRNEMKKIWEIQEYIAGAKEYESAAIDVPRPSI